MFFDRKVIQFFAMIMKWAEIRKQKKLTFVNAKLILKKTQKKN